MTSTTPVAEGEELTPIEIETGLSQAIRYAGMTWDAPPFIFSEEAAKSMGMPGRLVPGPLKLCLLADAVEQWLDGRGFVRHVRAAQRRPDIQGDPITILGRVTRVYEEDGHPRADLEVFIQNTHGEPSTRGFAVVQLNPGMAIVSG
ncbi:MAG: hypothetical protein ACSLFM_00960 [Tepidiformaceae bacterium]